MLKRVGRINEIRSGDQMTSAVEAFPPPAKQVGLPPCKSEKANRYFRTKSKYRYKATSDIDSTVLAGSEPGIGCEGWHQASGRSEQYPDFAIASAEGVRSRYQNTFAPFSVCFEFFVRSLRMDCNSSRRFGVVFG